MKIRLVRGISIACRAVTTLFTEGWKAATESTEDAAAMRVRLVLTIVNLFFYN